MKIEKTSTGWKEITIKNYIVDKIKLKFSTILDWLDFNKKHPTIKNRDKCQRCKVKWEDMDNKEGWVNLAIMIEELNKTLCCKCAAEIVAEKF